MDTVTTYFNAERGESLLFIAVGVITLALAAWCVLVLRKPFFTGVAVTLALVAMPQLVVGVTVYLRTSGDVARVQQMVQEAPARLTTEEVPRMQRGMRNFKLYLVVEVLLLIASLVVLALVTQSPMWRGAATGLVADSALTHRGLVPLKIHIGALAITA